MNAKSMQDQVARLKREILQLKAHNKHQMNYSMDLFDDTANNSFKGNKKAANTSMHKSQKQFTLLSQNTPKSVAKKGRSSFSSVGSSTKKVSKANYSQVINGSKSTQLIKVPILKGMFSYKKSFAYEDKKAKNNLNTSVMSNEMKINLLDDEMNPFSQAEAGNGVNASMHHHLSSQSIDLTKYKIISSQASAGNFAPIEPYLQANKPSSIGKIPNQLLSPNQVLSPTYNNPGSMQLSPVIINNINFSNSSSEMKAHTITTESFSFFKQKRKNERESRRMLIELIKLKNASLKQRQPIDSLLSAMNISPKVLEQEKRALKPLQSTPTLPLRSPQLNYSNAPKLWQSTTKSMSSLQQMQQFMSEMNDDNKDRINKVNFLSVPRVMSMLVNQSHVPYIFVLSPNSICHLYGIETYVFKWREFKDGSNYGYVDLLKVANCLRNKAVPNQFKIQIEDIGDNCTAVKTYEIEAASPEMSRNYADSLNFLSQLIKCKAFKRIGNFSPQN